MDTDRSVLRRLTEENLDQSRHPPDRFFSCWMLRNSKHLFLRNHPCNYRLVVRTYFDESSQLMFGKHFSALFRRNFIH